MSSEGDSRRWTILVLGEGGSRAFSRSVTTRTLWVAGVTVTLVLMVLGSGLGWALSRYQRSQRVEGLQQRITELRQEQERVNVLASRLDSITTAYRDLRRIMSGEVAASERDIQLPPAAPASEAVAAGGAGASPGWSWPLAQKGFVTRTHRPGPGGERGHPGLDIAVPTGSYVRAARAGSVIEAGRDSVYGRYVRVEHEEGHTTLYGHNRWVFVTEGDTVEQGEVLALSGSSGRSTAPHLHFEVARGDRVLDPIQVLGSEMSGRGFRERSATRQ